jgi:hypothetical protein
MNLQAMDSPSVLERVGPRCGCGGPAPADGKRVGGQERNAKSGGKRRAGKVVDGKG